MANPTTNFGWQMPTSTDLVTDLPADFEVFGQAVDTAFVDLKGGTTGQVLSKASATDLDFTWVAQDDSNAIQNAIVDAKGDLIGATAADTPARLAVGANNTVLTADSAEATGLKWAAPTSPTQKNVSIYNTAYQSIPNNTDTIITYNSENFDTDSFHSTVTNTSRITVPLAGKYLLTVSIGFAANGTGYRFATIKKNGTAFAPLDIRTSPSAVYDVQLNNSVTVNAAANDYFELQVFQNSGGNLNAGSTASLPFTCTYLGA
jgi:hypothetical protein